MSKPQPIFCCGLTFPIDTSNSNKLYNNPKRSIHYDIYASFLAFAARTERTVTLMALINGEPYPPRAGNPVPGLSSTPTMQSVPLPTYEAFANNPITKDTPYIMHLTSRHDFGPVLSHRYFMCPPNLGMDWVELSLIHWWAAGKLFEHPAEKWDLKCAEDEKFFRLTLRPNLGMRYVPPVSMVLKEDGIAGKCEVYERLY